MSNSGTSFNISTDRDKGYFRFYFGNTSNSQISYYFWQPMLTNTSTSQQWTPYGVSKCTSKLDDVNSSLTNDNVDSGVGTDFFDDFQDNSHGLTGIITAPLTAIQRITSSTCQPLVIPIPFTNGTVSLPCMTSVYSQHISTVYNIWKVVSFGIISYFICIDIFHLVKDFKDPESNKVEVLDL